MRNEMHIGLKAFVATSAVVILSLLFNRATADPELGVSTPDEIRIGGVMPYTGPLAAFASIGRTEAAYFQIINERGGINGHKLRFISYDDGSDPMRAYDQTRKLVEKDNVLLIFGSFGTPGNFAVHGYLNERQIPQLFLTAQGRAFFWPVQPVCGREGAQEG